MALLGKRGLSVGERIVGLVLFVVLFCVGQMAPFAIDVFGVVMECTGVCRARVDVLAGAAFFGAVLVQVAALALLVSVWFRGRPVSRWPLLSLPLVLVVVFLGLYFLPHG